MNYRGYRSWLNHSGMYVEVMGGTVSFRSKVREGTTFTIRILYQTSLFMKTVLIIEETRRREYPFNSFSRSFTLPDDVKEVSIDAKYENGLLKVSIARVKETPAKPALNVAVC